MNISVNPVKSVFVYEVNLTIEINVFAEHKDWLLNHFHSMVIENNFIKLNLFFVKNIDPIDDTHLRYQKVVVQYYVSDYGTLQRYLEKQAKKMRSQVVEKLGPHYSVSRRIFELVEIFNNERHPSCVVG